MISLEAITNDLRAVLVKHEAMDPGVQLNLTLEFCKSHEDAPWEQAYVPGFHRLIMTVDERDLEPQP